MKTILIFSGKGGSSKSTSCRELAVAGTLVGRRVAIVDLDPQKGLTGWYGRRAAEAPILTPLPPPYDLTALERAGMDEVYIDAPPGVPSYIANVIAKADAVLVPCRPSPDDLTAAGGVVELLADHPRWAFVLTQTLPRSRLTDSALRQLAALGRVAPVTLGSRQDYPAAAIEGFAAVEFPGKSAVEVNELRSYLFTVLGATHGKKAKR